MKRDDGLYEDGFYTPWEQFAHRLDQGVGGLVHSPQQWVGRQIKDDHLKKFLGMKVPDGLICRAQYIPRHIKAPVSAPFYN